MTTKVLTLGMSGFEQKRQSIQTRGRLSRAPQSIPGGAVRKDAGGQPMREVNRQWSERVQSEATLAAEFPRKIASASSFLDAVIVYQEWASQHLKLAIEERQLCDFHRTGADEYGMATAGGRGQRQKLGRFESGYANLFIHATWGVRP
jgi:hypothetical protein